MSTRASDHLDVERALLILRRRWWVIALFTVLVAAASFAFSKHQAKQYTATASVLFQNPQLSQEESGLQATPSSPTEDPTVMATNIQLLTQQTGVAEATARVVGHGLTPSGVSQAIGVSQQGQTSVANVSATSTDPGIAAAIANTYAAQFIAAQQAQQRASVQQALNLVERQLAALSNEQIAGTSGQALQDRAESLRILANLQDGGAQVVDSAKVPTSPSSPKPLRNTAVGLILGLLLGLSAAFLLEHLDRRMKTVEDLEQTYGLPLLAAVPHDKSYTLLRLRAGKITAVNARCSGSFGPTCDISTLIARSGRFSSSQLLRATAKQQWRGISRKRLRKQEHKRCSSTPTSGVLRSRASSLSGRHQVCRTSSSEATNRSMRSSRFQSQRASTETLRKPPSTSWSPATRRRTPPNSLRVTRWLTSFCGRRSDTTSW